MNMTNFELNELEKESGLSLTEILTEEEICEAVLNSSEYDDCLFLMNEKYRHETKKNKKKANRRHKDYRKAIQRRKLSNSILGNPIEKGKYYVFRKHDGSLKNQLNGIFYNNLHQYMNNKFYTAKKKNKKMLHSVRIREDVMKDKLKEYQNK